MFYFIYRNSTITTRVLLAVKWNNKILIEAEYNFILVTIVVRNIQNIYILFILPV